MSWSSAGVCIGVCSLFLTTSRWDRFLERLAIHFFCHCNSFRQPHEDWTLWHWHPIISSLSLIFVSCNLFVLWVNCNFFLIKRKKILRKWSEECWSVWRSSLFRLAPWISLIVDHQKWLKHACICCLLYRRMSSAALRMGRNASINFLLKNEGNLMKRHLSTWTALRSKVHQAIDPRDSAMSTLWYGFFLLMKAFPSIHASINDKLVLCAHCKAQRILLLFFFFVKKI